MIMIEESKASYNLALIAFESYSVLGYLPASKMS